MSIVYKEIENENKIFHYYPQIAFDKLSFSLRYIPSYLNILEYLYPFEATEIIDGLYLGSINSVYNKEKLQQLKIRNIISVLAGFEPTYPDDFNYLVINALDSTSTNLIQVFHLTNEFISNSLENNEGIFIHCKMGKSRSVTIVCAYLIRTFGFTVEKCLSILKNKRNIIEPNTFFIEQLQNYYNLLYN